MTKIILRINFNLIFIASTCEGRARASFWYMAHRNEQFCKCCLCIWEWLYVLQEKPQEIPGTWGRSVSQLFWVRAPYLTWVFQEWNMLTYFLPHSIKFHFLVLTLHVLFLEHEGLCDTSFQSCQFYLNSSHTSQAIQENIVFIVP